MNPWIFIFIGGLFETVWAVSMKESDGFTDPLWTIVTIVFIIISTYFLNKGLTMKLPIGASYSVWVGIGAIGSVIAGIVLFEEPMTFLKVIFIMLIIIGVIGLEMTTNEDQ